MDKKELNKEASKDIKVNTKNIEDKDFLSCEDIIDQHLLFSLINHKEKVIDK